MSSDPVRPISAKVKNPNTPESDKLPTVPHLVAMSDGTVLEIEATDPFDADKQARRLPTCIIQQIGERQKAIKDLVKLTNRLIRQITDEKGNPINEDNQPLLDHARTVIAEITARTP